MLKNKPNPRRIYIRRRVRFFYHLRTRTLQPLQFCETIRRRAGACSCRKHVVCMRWSLWCDMGIAPYVYLFAFAQKYAVCVVVFAVQCGHLFTYLFAYGTGVYAVIFHIFDNRFVNPLTAYGNRYCRRTAYHRRRTYPPHTFTDG